MWGVGRGGSWLSSAAAGSAADLPEATQMDEAEQVAVPRGHAGMSTRPRLAWLPTRPTPQRPPVPTQHPAGAGAHVHARTDTCTALGGLRAGLNVAAFTLAPGTAEGCAGE